MALENKPAPVHLGPTLRRLGKNLGRYHGETIDVERVLGQIQALATVHGWRRDCFHRTDRFSLLAYHRACESPQKRLYISAGIHGDEPAGPLAIAELLQRNLWPKDVEIWLCPCLNPSGFASNTRESQHGFDLNRQYAHPQAEETLAHISWLNQQPGFDVTLCLHEDWEAHGFYVYELNLDNGPTMGEAIIRQVAEVCPIDLSAEIEGREAHQGIIRPNNDLAARPEWPEALFLITHKTSRSCTLEAPSDFPLPTRVAALTTGVEAVFRFLMG